MIGHRIGKALAGEQGGANLGHHRTHPPDIGIARQKLQGIVEARAGLEQQREIARERW